MRKEGRGWQSLAEIAGRHSPIPSRYDKDATLKASTTPLYCRLYSNDRLPNVLLIVGLLVFLLQPVILSAQSNVTSPWTTYRQEDGLASNNVHSILPGDGEMWFGTDAGISRFNGEWKTFSPTEVGFQGTVNTLVAGTTAGEIWAGTDNGDVLFWDGSLWVNLVKVPGAAIHTLLPVGSELWIGSDNGLSIWSGAGAVSVERLGGIRVNTLAIQGNAIWAGTTHGLLVYQKDAWVDITTNDGLPWGAVSAMWADPGGPLWVAADDRLQWRDQATGNWNNIETEVLQLADTNLIVSMAGDADGTVWGATFGSGPFRVDGRSSLASFSGAGEIGLTTSLMQSVAIDNDGLIWFGTSSGLFRYDEKMWVKELADNLTYPGINRISAIESSVAGELWIGTATSGIRKKPINNGAKDETLYTTATHRLPTNFITDLAHDSTGAIWASTHNGLARYNRTTDDWETPVPSSEFPSELINVLLAEDDSLWIGTDGGLAEYSLTTGAVNQISALGDIHVTALTVDSLGRVWVGTLENGLFIHQTDGSWQQYANWLDEGYRILRGAVVALAADPNTSGGVWVGVNEAGINYWDGNQWHDLTVDANLPSKLIYQFYTDPLDGSLWIGTEGGVSRYDGRTWGALVVEGVLPSAAILAIGRSGDSYWFGGRDGLTYYRPDRTAPQVRFERVAGTSVVGQTGSIRVEADKEIFIDYVVSDLYTTKNEIVILYRLSGPGQIGEWEIAPEGNVSFALAPGVANLDIQARDQAFNYSDEVRLSLEAIAPPAMFDPPLLSPIRRDYFIALVLTALIAVAGASYSISEFVRNRRRTREAISRGFNPFVSGEPIREVDMFFGRHDLLQRIVDTLHNNSIMIHGERRIGKTSLLLQLVARLREVEDDRFWFIPLYVDLEGTTEESFFHVLIEEILNGVWSLPNAAERLRPNLTELLYYKTSETNYTDREFGRDLRDLIVQLQLYGEISHPLKQLRIILLLDEMDVMSNYSRIVQQRLRRIFMREFAATLGAVVAGIEISKEWDRVESPWYNLFNEIQLEPFNREQAIELLIEPVRGYYEYEPAALERILEESGGKPYRLQQYALEAVNHMLSEERRQIRLDDVEYAHDHIERVGNDVQIGTRTANGHSTAAQPNGSVGLESADNELKPGSD